MPRWISADLEIEVPQLYSLKSLRHAIASPSNVNLSSHPYYFEVGAEVAIL